MVREFIRLDADGKPLEAKYQVYETHTLPEMVGEINYDVVPSNRFKIGYFGLLRARLIALWDAEEISAKEMANMITGVANGNLDADPFGDEAVADATDETVLEMILNLKDVTDKLASIEANWNQELDKIEPVLTREMCAVIGVFIISGVAKLQQETVSMFSEEQLTAYEELSKFLTESEFGVAIV
tara:strand:+ start:86 stop:640 length:555 start_codon:yes stop_codon:yes gene_type:complete